MVRTKALQLGHPVTVSEGNGMPVHEIPVTGTARRAALSASG
jgi:hypothetical protein